jgi:hypothetical protein
MKKDEEKKSYVAVVAVAAEPSRQAAMQRTGFLLHMMGLSGSWVDGGLCRSAAMKILPYP